MYCGNFVFLMGGGGGGCAICLWNMLTIVLKIFHMAIYTLLSGKIDFGTNHVFVNILSSSMPWKYYRGMAEKTEGRIL